jgi:hypothetical protein
MMCIAGIVLWAGPWLLVPVMSIMWVVSLERVDGINRGVLSALFCAVRSCARQEGRSIGANYGSQLSPLRLGV